MQRGICPTVRVVAPHFCYFGRECVQCPLRSRPVIYPWSDQAACRGMDPELFFPERWELGWTDTRIARAICAGCPVCAECLETALQRHEYGIWGGTSEKQRIRMRGRRFAEHKVQAG